MDTRQTFAPITDRLATSNSEYSRYAAGTILAALEAGPSGTMRAWMEARNGRSVTTVQIDRNTGGAWAPTGRTISATRAGSVQLDGSTRDYAGMRVQHVTADCLIVQDDWHTIAYLIEH